MAGPLPRPWDRTRKITTRKNTTHFIETWTFDEEKSKIILYTLDSTIVLEGWEDVKASDQNITSNSNLTLPLTESLFTAFLN
jgi:hypothetical protein